MFKTRLKTGAWLFVAVSAALLFSHIPVVLTLSVAFLCIFSVWEMSIALHLPNKTLPVAVSMLELAVLMLMPNQLYGTILAVLFACMVAFFGILMHNMNRVEELKKSEKYLVMTAIPVLFSSIKYIRELPEGLVELTVAILVCTITDSCAYLVGRRYGRHKLAPRISPSKTVEGSVGGTLSTAAVLLLAAVWISMTQNIEMSFVQLTIYLVTASFIGQFGDLCMSTVKRIAKIKDYGDLLPGHGGILDRFDSQLFVLPYTYLFCAICGRIF